MRGGAEGFTTADGSKRVVVDSGLSAGSRASVLAHELGHIKAGHLDRVDEYHAGHGGSRGAMEVEAESISFVLCRHAGMKTPGETASTYVKGWERTVRDQEQVKNSAQTVAKAVKEVLGNPAFHLF